MLSLRRIALGIFAIFLSATVVLFLFQEEIQIQLEKQKISWAKTSGSFPTSETPAHIKGPIRENATLFTLCQNMDLHKILPAIRSVENQFNDRFHYDWVFLNDEEFTSRFKEKVSEAVSGEAHFGKIDESMWGYPDWIDLEKAGETRKWMREHNVVYGDLESYHHMCRFQSGFFFRHPLMEKYRYSWRVEPGIKILCKQKVDPFTVMRNNELAYGFNIAPQEIKESVTTLWNRTKEYLDSHPENISKDNLMEFVSDDNGENFNLCHFWTNFEISDMDWLRSSTYTDYFNFLDQAGGFYYERWGDAPIRSIAASLFLPKNKVHFFNDIGYFHSPYGHCPYNQGPLELECSCQPGDGEFSNRFYDYHKNSCMRRYFTAKGRTFHDQNPELKD